MWHINGVMGACPVEAYHRISSSAPDRQAGTAAPAMGRADVKVKVLDAKLCSKCYGVLKDRRSVDLLDCTPAALLEVLTIEMPGHADCRRMCTQLQGCCGQPLMLQRCNPGAGKSKHWLEQTHQMRGLHCCHNTAMHNCT